MCMHACAYMCMYIDMHMCTTCVRSQEGVTVSTDCHLERMSNHLDWTNGGAMTHLKCGWLHSMG